MSCFELSTFSRPKYSLTCRYVGQAQHAHDYQQSSPHRSRGIESNVVNNLISAHDIPVDIQHNKIAKALSLASGWRQMTKWWCLHAIVAKYHLFPVFPLLAIAFIITTHQHFGLDNHNLILAKMSQYIIHEKGVSRLCRSGKRDLIDILNPRLVANSWWELRTRFLIIGLHSIP